MGIIIVLISISLSIAIFFLAVFYWNMKSGQYDDTYTPSVRILFDNQPALKRPVSTQHTKEEIRTDKPSEKEVQQESRIAS